MKFAALNKQSSDSNSVSTPSSKKGGLTKEAQESACLQLYHTAIRHQQDGQLEQARALYREVLESEVMDEAEEALTDGRSVQSSTLLKLKFLIYKNLAGIAKEQGDLSAAVDAYIQAASVDTSDITMWYQLSSAASALGNLLLARTALEQALHCNERYWPAIESLCTVLFALQDFSACLRVVTRGLELEPKFPRGIAYLHHILQECPDLTYQFAELRIHLMTPCAPDYEKYLKEASELKQKKVALSLVTVLEEPIIPPKKLSYFSIVSLGKCLISVYQHCRELSKKKPSFAVRVDLSAIVEGTSEGPSILSPSPTRKLLTTGSPKAIKGGVFSDEPQGSGEEGIGGGRREAKRKLTEADFSACLPKRRSTRVKSKGKEHAHHNFFEMLQQYVPAWLQLTALPEIGDLSPLAKSKDVSLESASIKSERQRKLSEVIDSTSKLTDRETVFELLDSWKSNCGIINLLYKFVLFLASHYNCRWAAHSFLTVRVFLDVYELLHPHLSYPSPFCSPDSPEMDYSRQLATIALCYVELSVDSLHRRALCYSKKPFETSSASITSTLPKCFHECLTFVQFCSGLVGDDPAKRAYSLRVSWCLARLRILWSENEAATLALLKCKAILEEADRDSDCAGATGPLVVYLCNCATDQTISLDHVNEKLKSLEQSLSFEQIHQLFENEKYSTVVDKLLPILDQETGTFMEFLIGSERVVRKTVGLSYLLQSLLKLNRTQVCFQCCTQALLELLQHYKMGNEQWVTALRDAFCTIDRCLDEKNIGELLDTCDQRALKRLVICVLKTLDIANDMADSPLLLLMPICLPWKVFYIIISSDWMAGREVTITQDTSDEVVCDSTPMEVDQTPSDPIPSTTPTLIASSTATSVAPPTFTPATPPTAAPMTPPTFTPATPPTAAPVTPPTVPPATPPTAPPVTPPTAAPATPPTAAPVAPPTAPPMTPPTSMPVTSSPVTPPTSAPMTPPTVQPHTFESIPRLVQLMLQPLVATAHDQQPAPDLVTADDLQTPSGAQPQKVSSPTGRQPLEQIVPHGKTLAAQLQTPSPTGRQSPGQTMPRSEALPPQLRTPSPTGRQSPGQTMPCSEALPPQLRTPSPTGRQSPGQTMPHSEALPPQLRTPSPTGRQSPGQTMPRSEALPPQLRTPSPTGRQSPGQTMPRSEALPPQLRTPSPTGRQSPGQTMPRSEALPPQLRTPSPTGRQSPGQTMPRSEALPPQLRTPSPTGRQSPGQTMPHSEALPPQLRTPSPTGRQSPGQTMPCSEALPPQLRTPSPIRLPLTSGSPAVVASPRELSTLRPSLQFLKEAHNHLGSMGWCCRDEGCFLLTSVATLRKELRVLTALPQKQREMLLLELEQCYHCLYGHPNKKIKAHGLQDHGSEQVYLTWEAALMLVEYYHPSFLPCFDDTKSNQTTTELLTLYKRIIEAIPDIGQVLSMDALNEFIDGTTDRLPEPKPPHQHSSLISEVYYLLADDSLKSGDNHKAIRYYLLNLCYFPGRFDSWAGLALARLRKIVERLNMRDFKSGTEKYVQKQARPTVRCFEQAMSLNPKHCYILEKFGFFCYNVQAFTSQIISHPELFSSREIQQWAGSSRREMLQLAESCFQKALDLEGTKHAEPWIYCLMLGKIGHKLGRNLGDSLGHLLKSAKTLRRDGAIYPEYMELSAKGHAVEAIEVHYQLHSCALKHLLQEDGSSQKIDSSELEQISDIICQVRQLPLGQVDYPALWEWVGQVVLEAVGRGGSSSSRLTEGVEKSVEKGTVGEGEGSSKRLLPVEAVPIGPITEVLNRSAKGEEKAGLVEQHGSEAVRTITSAVAVPGVQISADVSDAVANQPVTVLMESEPVTTITEEVLVVTASSQIHTDGPPSVSMNMPVSDFIPPPPTSPLSLTDKEEEPEAEKMDTHEPQSLYASEPKSDSKSIGWEVKQLEVGNTQRSQIGTKISDPLTSAQHTCVGSNDGNRESELQASAIATEIMPTFMNYGATHITPVFQKLLHQCIYSVLVCVVRCPDFFKSLYRFASVLHRLGLNKLARQMLLGPLPQPLLETQEKLLPLFVLKGNIFTNMWQIPSREINRPGTFSTHARRNLDVLLHVLAVLKDSHSLIFLAQALKSKPDTAKQYMRDNERVIMFKKAVKQCVVAMKDLSKDISLITTEQLPRLLTDAYTARGLAAKVDGREQSLTKVMDDILLQLYKAFTDSITQESGMECEPSVEPQLEAAIKFCQAKQKTIAIASSF